MPSVRIPKLCLHKATGQAYVVLPGTRKQIYLGLHGTAAADAEYRRIVAELVADPAAESGDARTGSVHSDLTVNELALAYLEYCETYYAGPDGEQTREVVNIEHGIRTFRRLYGHTLVREMRPRWLKTLQHTLVEQGLCRREVNRRVGKVKRMIKWGVAEEVVPPSVFHGLLAVEGLRRGRSGAKDHEPARPVSDADVNAVKPFLSRQVWAMIELQRMAAPGLLLLATWVGVGVSVWLTSRLGADFLPPFDEGSIQVNVSLPTGSSLQASNRACAIIDGRLALMRMSDADPKAPILHFLKRTGRAERDEHAQPVTNTEYILTMNPRSGLARAEALRSILKDLKESLPGVDIEAEQPLVHLISQMLSGVYAQIGVKVSSRDGRRQLSGEPKCVECLDEVAADQRRWHRCRSPDRSPRRRTGPRGAGGGGPDRTAAGCQPCGHDRRSGQPSIRLEMGGLWF